MLLYLNVYYLVREKSEHVPTQYNSCIVLRDIACKHVKNNAAICV